MKKGLIFFFLIGALNSLGQWSVDFRYLYFQNTQVNKAVEAMNLSHSFLDEGTQYVHHGYGIALNKYLKVSGPRGIYVRLEMPYHRLDQWSQWGTVNRKFNTSQLGLNAQLIFNPKAIKGKMTTGPLGPRFYFMAGAGYHFWQSKIKVNGEISYTSERRAYPTFSAGMGHRMFLIGQRCVLSPFVNLQMTPSWNSADMQKAISGTAWQVDNTGIAWQGQLGIEATFLKKEKKRRGLLKNLFHRKVKSATDI
jgi:hypothetical protein